MKSLFDAALAAVSADRIVPSNLPPPPKGRTLVVGAGKGAAAMARAVEEHWAGDLAGLVITRYGHGLPLRRIEVVEAAHPVPDQAGEQAARRILDAASALGEDDLLLCLISGGGSALMAVPAEGLTLADKRAVTGTLLRCGATIGEINCVRKHLSAIKGGRLALAAWPAEVVTIAVSDVPGDDPATIASGPTVPDPTSFADARAILEKYAIAEPAGVLRHLAAAREETPKPGDPRLARARCLLAARPADALAAAARMAEAAGYGVELLGDDLEGEARDVGRAHGELALRRRAEGRRRHCILSGGETTVTVRGRGRGGRNAEFLLALAIALDGAAGISAIAADTDGIDGSEENAGAFLLPDTKTRAAAAGIDAAARLADNDAHGFFEALGELLVTGPTLTNVNDFRAIVID
ncbi:MAG: glycerate kinase [Alphaproteobacteria bacterium]|nr:glycerate kinase [Alphaproteobacteria bacterium]